MGNKYEVYIYVEAYPGNGRYSFTQVHGSESLLRAIIATVKAKRRNPYVKFEWR